MRFPSITPYIEAVSNLSERLRTINDVKPVLDKSGEPLFYASKGMITFVIERNGAISSLRCFTSVMGYKRLTNLLEAEIIHGEIFEHEILVFNNDQICDYYTVFIENSSTPIQANDANSEFSEGLIPAENNGLWGYTDRNGHIAIEYTFNSASEFMEGRAVIEKNGFYGLIDRDGNSIIAPEFDEISWDGSALAYVDKGGKWGCYDRLGRKVVECQYCWVSEFSNSMLLVRKNKKYGYVDLQGKEAIPPVYDYAASFNEHGIAGVTICGEHMMINKKGEIEQ